LVAGLFLFPISMKDYADVYGFISPVTHVQNNTGPLPSAPAISSGINLAFFGDLMLDRSVADRLENKKLDSLLSGLASSTNLAQFDLVGANLEGTVTNQGEHYDPKMIYDFAFLPSCVAELKNYNFSYFAIANNHISDQGTRGVNETRENLKDIGFNFSGDIDSKISEYSITYVSIKGKKIALIALATVNYKFNEEKAKELIASARRQADWIIINIHWGKEYQHQQDGWQQKTGQELIDDGADIIIGHHPHVVEGIEIYKNRPIFYSLGNFIFDQYFSLDTQEELGLKINLSENNINIDLWPLRSDKSAPNLMAEDEKKIFLENLASWSQADDTLKTQIKAQHINIAK